VEGGMLLHLAKYIDSQNTSKITSIGCWHLLAVNKDVFLKRRQEENTFHQHMQNRGGTIDIDIDITIYIYISMEWSMS
jgi:hypothetical protein